MEDTGPFRYEKFFLQAYGILYALNMQPAHFELSRELMVGSGPTDANIGVIQLPASDEALREGEAKERR